MQSKTKKQKNNQQRTPKGGPNDLGSSIPVNHQMTYPAPYSMSWTAEKPKMTNKSNKKSHSTGRVKKNPANIHSQGSPKDMKKRPTHPIGVTQIMYPTPFIKTNAPHSDRKVLKIRKNATAARKLSQKVNRAIDPYSSSWQPCCRVAKAPDPTVPHLKYGVFQPNKTKPPAKTQTPAPKSPQRRPHSPSAERANKKKINVVKGVSGDHRDSHSALPATRQLSITTPTHLDIKPKGWRDFK